MTETTIRDQFWRGIPKPVQAWAALTREGNLMPFSVRERPEDVRLACGECVPVRVLITYVAEPNERKKPVLKPIMDAPEGGGRVGTVPYQNCNDCPEGTETTGGEL